MNMDIIILSSDNMVNLLNMQYDLKKSISTG